MTLSELESHLWESANILRGPVDAADFKTYIFPLLFFKRVSDVHDEEREAALAEFSGDDEAASFSENYRFQIPEGCHWRDVRQVATNVGQALQTPTRSMEFLAMPTGRTRTASVIPSCATSSSIFRGSIWATRPPSPTSSASPTNTSSRSSRMPPIKRPASSTPRGRL